MGYSSEDTDYEFVLDHHQKWGQTAVRDGDQNRQGWLYLLEQFPLNSQSCLLCLLAFHTFRLQVDTGGNSAGAAAALAV